MALGDLVRAPRTDEFGVPISSELPRDGIYPTVPTTSRGIGGMPATVTRQRDPYALGFPSEEVDVTPTGLPGSPMNTLYGVDSESYLTDDQRKLARQIQGKFDQSVGFRDRELQRYGAPRLSSFVEDEALARAMSLARGLNFPEQEVATPILNPIRQGTPVGPARPPAAVPKPPPSVPRDRYAEWAKVMSGLMSIAPLLFGRNAYGEFLNKGLINQVKQWYGEITGTNPAAITDQYMADAFNRSGAGMGIDTSYPTLSTADWLSMQQGGSYLPDPSDVLGAGGGGFESAITTPLISEIPVEGISDFGWDFSSLGGP